MMKIMARSISAQQQVPKYLHIYQQVLGKNDTHRGLKRDGFVERRHIRLSEVQNFRYKNFH